MARYDVDAAATTYHPSRCIPEQPRRNRANDGSSTRSAYWSYLLTFESTSNMIPAAAFEEWEAFDDGALHSIVLPPPNDSAGGDATYSSVSIEIADWPEVVSVNVSDFSVRVYGVEFTS